MINWQNGVTPINETNMNKLVQEDMITDAYSSSRTYAVGDYCIYGNTLYKCTTAISTAEVWNSAHWTAVNISDELESIKGELSNKLNSNKVIQESGTASTSNVYSSSAVEKLIKGTTLYENASGSNSDITLSETLANYSYIEVFYKNNDHYYNSMKVDNPNGKDIVLTGNTAAIYMGYPNLVIKTQTRSCNGTSLTVTNSQDISFYNGSLSAHTSTNNIYITKVIGYK